MNTNNDQENERQKNAFIEKLIEIIEREQESAIKLEKEKIASKIQKE